MVDRTPRHDASLWFVDNFDRDDSSDRYPGLYPPRASCLSYAAPFLIQECSRMCTAEGCFCAAYECSLQFSIARQHRRVVLSVQRLSRSNHALDSNSCTTGHSRRCVSSHRRQILENPCDSGRFMLFLTSPRSQSESRKSSESTRLNESSKSSGSRIYRASQPSRITSRKSSESTKLSKSKASRF